jgi:MarR family transcriptional regulator, organic hydroperoxide resistance regulator
MGPTKELRYLILALQREGNRLLVAGLKPLGLTPAQAEALTVLAEYGPLSLSGLGELLVCETGTSPSRIVERIAAAGLVSREPDEEDRRTLRLSLTEEGGRTVGRIREVEADLEGRLDHLLGGADPGPALDLLRSMAGSLPAGHALHRRTGGRVPGGT